LKSSRGYTPKQNDTIKICRKEAKECGYWLKLVEVGHPDLEKEREVLLKESIELMKIFGSILTKSQ
jgi:four helix bundle protein